MYTHAWNAKIPNDRRAHLDVVLEGRLQGGHVGESRLEGRPRLAALGLGRQLVEAGAERRHIAHGRRHECPFLLGGVGERAEVGRAGRGQGQEQQEGEGRGTYHVLFVSMETMSVGICKGYIHKRPGTRARAPVKKKRFAIGGRCWLCLCCVGDGDGDVREWMVAWGLQLVEHSVSHPNILCSASTSVHAPPTQFGVLGTGQGGKGGICQKSRIGASYLTDALRTVAMMVDIE